MAIVEFPNVKKVKGKLGNVVMYNLRGQIIMRTLPFCREKTKTQKQKAHYQKFSLLSKLSKLLENFINKGFVEIPIRLSARNGFLKENFSNVFIGDYPKFTIDYSRLIVAQGSLFLTTEEIKSSVVGRHIEILWTDNSDQKNAKSTDKAMALFFNQTKNEVVYDTDTRTRVDCSLNYTLPETWIGDMVFIYFAFKNASGDKTSNGIFLGSKIILA